MNPGEREEVDEEMSMEDDPALDEDSAQMASTRRRGLFRPSLGYGTKGSSGRDRVVREI